MLFPAMTAVTKQEKFSFPPRTNPAILNIVALFFSAYSPPSSFPSTLHSFCVANGFSPDLLGFPWPHGLSQPQPISWHSEPSLSSKLTPENLGLHDLVLGSLVLIVYQNQLWRLNPENSRPPDRSSRRDGGRDPAQVSWWDSQGRGRPHRWSLGLGADPRLSCGVVGLGVGWQKSALQTSFG